MILTSILLLVAIVEFYPEARHRRQIFGPRWDYVSVYDTDDLMQNADLSSKKHLVYLDFGALTRDTHYDLTSWALRKDMTVNCFYFARQMESGFDPDKGVEDDALYVFSSPDVASSYSDELILYQAPDIVIGVKNELKGADAFRL